MKAHEWETAGRLRECASCGARQYLRCTPAIKSSFASTWLGDVAEVCGARLPRGEGPRRLAGRPPKRGEIQRRIVALIAGGRTTTPQLSEALGKPTNWISATLGAMERQRLVERAGLAPVSPGGGARPVIYRLPVATRAARPI